MVTKDDLGKVNISSWDQEPKTLPSLVRHENKVTDESRGAVFVSHRSKSTIQTEDRATFLETFQTALVELARKGSAVRRGLESDETSNCRDLIKSVAEQFELLIATLEQNDRSRHIHASSQVGRYVGMIIDSMKLAEMKHYLVTLRNPDTKPTDRLDPTKRTWGEVSDLIYVVRDVLAELVHVQVPLEQNSSLLNAIKNKPKDFCRGLDEARAQCLLENLVAEASAIGVNTPLEIRHFLEKKNTNPKA